MATLPLKKIIPTAKHSSSRFDFTDLLQWCLNNDQDYASIMEPVIVAMKSVHHVKKVRRENVRRTKAYVGVQWDYDIPTGHLARRELTVEQAVRAALFEITLSD